MARLLPPERDIGVMRAPVSACLALAGIFLLVVLALALLERIGARAGAALTGVVGAAFALFVFAALLSQSRRAADFYVADRKVSGPFGGFAAASTLAGLLTLELAGGAYSSVTEFLLAAAGFGLGYLILALLLAPRLRSFGAYAPGDILALRFGGIGVRLAWALIGFSSSFLLLVAVLKMAAPLLESLLGLGNGTALYLTGALMLVSLLPGGMRSLTWTQAIQFFVIGIACVTPSVYLVVAHPPPAGLLESRLGTLAMRGLLDGQAHTLFGVAAPFVVSAIGVAALPQLTARTLTAASGREAATAIALGVLFAAALACAGLMLVELLLASMPSQPTGDEVEQIGALLAALPAVLSGLALAGALAALLALGQAALFAAVTALSHELFEETVDRRAPEGRRIVVARLTLAGVAMAAAASAPLWPMSPPALLQWALAFAASGSFVPLLLALWWRRLSRLGILGGMAAGFGFTAIVFLAAVGFVPVDPASGSWAAFGAPVTALVGVAVALVASISLSFAVPRAEKDGGSPPFAAEARQTPPIRERPA